jgi:hypothetical protein
MHPSINRLIDDHLGRAARVHTSAKRQGLSYIKTAKSSPEENPCKLPRVTIKIKLMVKKNRSGSRSVTPV